MSFKKAIPIPSPLSMSSSDAAAWYLSMIPEIPEIRPGTYTGDDDFELQHGLFKEHWGIKSSLRLAAAAALIEQELTGEFLQKLPLLPINEYLGTALLITKGQCLFTKSAFEEVCKEATDLLLTISEQERRAFPRTLAESIGMRCNSADGVYIMTEAGWQKE